MARWLVMCSLLVCASARADLHDPWDTLLQRYVDDDGRVAYKQLQSESSDTLDAYLRGLQGVDVSQLSPTERIALWINAYNAHVVRGVLDGYSAEGFFGRKRFFSFYSFDVAGKTRTLDDIEHTILRRQYREPRIHFALVCASTSCPKLRREAYRGERLDQQLDSQARSFIDDPQRNQFTADPIRISSIFKWFAEDFVSAAGSVPAFLRRYRTIPGEPQIDYLEYDWTMNAQPGQRP